MMRSLFSNLFVVILFICLTKNASCLSCYECGTSIWTHEVECDEAGTLKPSMIKECPDPDSICLKGELEVGDNIFRRKIRKCQKLDPGDKIYMDKTSVIKGSFMGISGTTHICYTDLCNGTGGVFPSTVMILVISAVLSKYFSMYLYC